MPPAIFIAGATGYVGRTLAEGLLERGHTVHALARPGSEHKVTPGCRIVSGDALDPATFTVPAGSTLVHLIGVAKPAPWKEKEFHAVDLVSVQAMVKAAVRDGVRHIVYVSVAQPAPIMKAYIRVRSECERLIRATGIPATILRPWYVLGPGHWWPAAVLPLYWLLERLPPTRDAARRLGLVSWHQMRKALVGSVENPGSGVQVLEVPSIRKLLLKNNYVQT